MSHIAFEVQSMDDVFRGHFALKEAARNGKRYAHAWGIGRHLQGSQVYDYWHDPWGHVHEHWCDGDQVNEDNAHRKWSPGDMVGAGDQWGPTVDESNAISLFGPDQAPHFKEITGVDQDSILSRDLSACTHIEIVANTLRHSNARTKMRSKL